MEPLSLDQLRVFVAVADAGGFAAAARELHRAQSAVSYAVANLERLLDVTLFDRSRQRATLTDAGHALLAEARVLCAQASRLSALARTFRAGVEPEVSLAVDVVFPTDRLAASLREFQDLFPGVRLDLRVETMWTVAELVAEGACVSGISGPVPQLPEGLVRRRIPGFRMLPVAAPDHPLSVSPGPFPLADTRRHIQLVLSDPSRLARGSEGPGLAGGASWRLGDLHTKHALLRAGLGWGFMPDHLIEADLASGALVRLPLADADDLPTPLYVLHRSDAPPGPAARWLIDRLSDLPPPSHQAS